MDQTDRRRRPQPTRNACEEPPAARRGMKGTTAVNKTKVPETVPRQYGGKWVAWTKDAMKIVAVGETPEEVRAAAERAGVHDPVYQWVPPADERFVGGG